MFLTQGMFLIEVGIERITCFVESKNLIIKCVFADTFSLELKDPKKMDIILPEAPPLPPKPNNFDKKNKKTKLSENKLKKFKKNKRKRDKAEATIVAESLIKAGQSILFRSNIEFLMQKMKDNPLQLSLWDKHENLIYIGANSIPWSGEFLEYLSKVIDCDNTSPVMVKDEYSIFEENSGKLIARAVIEVKLIYFKDKIVTTFRSLSNSPLNKMFLYKNIAPKSTNAYLCIDKSKSPDKVDNTNNKIEKRFNRDIKPKEPIKYATFKNAASVNLNSVNNMNTAFKQSLTTDDIDKINDHIKKIIKSCNDDLRTITPRPTIKPRIKATDIDKVCYCNQTNWPDSELAKRVKKDLETSCPVCANKAEITKKSQKGTFEIANIRGPCGRHDCKIAKHIRSYIENLLQEDNKEFYLDEIVGPCGSKSCTLAEIIIDFIHHVGVFRKVDDFKGLSTQCTCENKIKEAYNEKVINKGKSNTDCEESTLDSDDDGFTISSQSHCGGSMCDVRKVYNEKIGFQ